MAVAASLGMMGAASAAPVVGQISFLAYADAIGSSGMGAATGLDFVSGALGSASPNTPGGLTGFGAGTGSFAGLGCASLAGSCGVIQDIQSFASSAPISTFLSLATGGPTISFDLSTITGVTHASDATGGSVIVTGTGVFHFSGLDDTLASFSFTAQGNSVTSFSATVAAVPEPASIAILGGSLAGLGILRRKRS